MPIKKKKSAGRRISSPRSERGAESPEEMMEETAVVPGAVIEDEPIGSPHSDLEPGAAAPDEPAYFYGERVGGGWQFSAGEPAGAEEEAREEEDLHAYWQEKEEEYARKKVRLLAVVGLTMAAIVGIWASTLAEGIRRQAPSPLLGDSITRDFLSELNAYQQRLDQLSSQAAINTNAPKAAPSSALLEALKIKAAEAAATSSKK